MAKILLIDDEADTVAANRSALEAQGHHIAVASSATEALAALPVIQPDVIVVETMVVGLSGGFVFADRLAELLGARRLIILTRAHELLDDEARRSQDRDGWIRAARFIEKPVPPETLADELEHVLEEL